MSVKYWSRIIFEVSKIINILPDLARLSSFLMLEEFSSILICSCHSLKYYNVSSEHGLWTILPPWHDMQVFGDEAPGDLLA